MLRPLLSELRSRWRDVWSLIVLGRHVSAPSQAYQEELIRGRLRTLSIALGILSVLWLLVDWAYLPDADFRVIVVLRCGLSLSLLALGWGTTLRWKPFPALRWLCALIVLQSAAFATMQSALSAPAPPLLRLGYGFFPLIVVSQLAFFPLPVRKSILLAVPAMAALLMAPGGNDNTLGMPWLASAWLFALILSLASWAGATQLSLMVDLLEARKDAAIDPLTGLANRRSAMSRLHSELSRAQRSAEPLSVLVFDLDHFKHINDRLGHAGGDQVLVKLAQVVNEELRAADFVARIGGEEFLVLLPATATEQAQRIAERMRQRIEQAHVRTRTDDAVRFTASIGVATWLTHEDGVSLLTRADTAMYQAKGDGRNRVRTAAISAVVQPSDETPLAA